jgi:hypothetical protein
MARERISARQLLRFAGALALLGVGIDHIVQYYGDSYSVIPTIGTLFALNFASILALLALSGIGIAAGSLVGLVLSEHGGLFGFTEQGYREAIVISIVLEVATVMLLGLFVALHGLGLPSRRKRRLSVV